MDERLQACRVASSRLVEVPGIFERNYTAYGLLAKVAEGDNAQGRAVEKRFAEFTQFHEALTPALDEAVGERRRRAERQMLEARKAMAAVDTMQKHVQLLGTILEKADGGWFGKNNPDEVANRIRMLNSYLRGAMRFAEHERVHEALASFVLNGSKEADWTPDPDDPNQVIDTIEEEADGRKKMIEQLFSSQSISAAERDDMIEKLEKEQSFEVHTVIAKHTKPTDSKRVAAAEAAGAAVAGPAVRKKLPAVHPDLAAEGGAVRSASAPSDVGALAKGRPESPLSTGDSTDSGSEVRCLPPAA